MDAVVGFLVIMLFVVLAVYPFMKNRSLGSVIDFCIAFPLAIGATIALLGIFEYISSFVHIDIDLGLSILLSVVGIPGTFIVMLIIIFRGLKYAEKSIRRELKKGRIRHQFAVAKALIRSQQYQKAQAILSTISDPKARQWEAKLSRLIPHDPDFLRQIQQ